MIDILIMTAYIACNVDFRIDKHPCVTKQLKAIEKIVEQDLSILQRQLRAEIERRENAKND